MIPDEWDVFSHRLGWVTGALKRPAFVDHLKSLGVTHEQIDAAHNDLLEIASFVMFFGYRGADAD